RGNAILGQEQNKVAVYLDRLNLGGFANISPYLENTDIVLDLRAELVFVKHELSEVQLVASNVAGEYGNSNVVADKIKIMSGGFSVEAALPELSFKLNDLN